MATLFSALVGVGLTAFLVLGVYAGIENTRQTREDAVRAWMGKNRTCVIHSMDRGKTRCEAVRRCAVVSGVEYPGDNCTLCPLDCQ